jgi:hypothetical protein
MKIYTYKDGSLVSITDNRILQEAQKENIDQFRSFVSELLTRAKIDTATQQNAALGIYPPERCEAIKSYIAACRNEYLRCKAMILAATTNDEADAVTFTAPPVPEGL